jgi:hypothetical protein
MCVPSLYVANVQTGHGDIGDRVLGDESGTAGVIATRRLRPDALVDLTLVGISRDDPADRLSGRSRRNQGMCMPEAARAMTRRWISEVPSKSV